MEEIPAGPGKTKLKKGEFITSVFLPARGARCADAYLRFIPRNEMDIAVGGVGASITLDGDKVKAARIALGAVGPTPIFAEQASKSLVGKTLDDAAIEQAAELAIQASSPIDDMRGTAEFRRHIVGVLTRRTIQIAAERARSK